MVMLMALTWPATATPWAVVVMSWKPMATSCIHHDNVMAVLVSPMALPCFTMGLAWAVPCDHGIATGLS